MQDLRICFVGDSYINGSGDEQCLGWIGRLCERRFTRQFRLTVYDLGIRGATTDILVFNVAEFFLRRHRRGEVPFWVMAP
jgi:hypothetical protein